MTAVGMGVGAFAVTVTLGSVLAAQPAVRITYSAPEGCPTAAQFREAVQERAPELVDAPEGERARSFLVNTEQNQGRAYGSVVISDPSGATVTRRLEGDDCGDVAEALAFIVAELGRAPRLEDEPAAAPSEQPVIAASLAPRVEKTSAPESRRSSEPEVERARSTRLRWEAGTGVELVLAPAPDWMVAPLAYVEVLIGRDGSAPSASGRVTVSYGKSGTIAGTVGDTELRWLAGRAELCGWLLGANPILAGCGSLDLGALQGRGGGAAAAPKTETAVWLAPGLSLRAVTTLERILVFGLEAGAFFPLVRPRFFYANGDEVADSETIHEVPALGIRVQGSVGMRFP